MPSHPIRFLSVQQMFSSSGSLKLLVERVSCAACGLIERPTSRQTCTDQGEVRGRLRRWVPHDAQRPEPRNAPRGERACAPFVRLPAVGPPHPPTQSATQDYAKVMLSFKVAVQKYGAAMDSESETSASSHDLLTLLLPPPRVPGRAAGAPQTQPPPCLGGRPAGVSFCGIAVAAF